MSPTVIALGANIGDAAATIRRAMIDLDTLEGIHIDKCSSIYCSAPMAIPDVHDEISEYDTTQQPDYMNAVVLASVSCEPLTLLGRLQHLENQYGRVRERRWGPRTLDLDIVTCGELQIDLPRLIVPHPDAYRRCFVLVPLVEILPDHVIPGYGKAVDLLPKCETGKVRKYIAAER